METGDLYNAGNSFRRNSSSIWRSGGVEAYSKSSGDEDDEEALKWAALEKLPTFNRLKKGLLTSPEGETSEIDIHNLGLHERKILIDRLLKIPEEDNEKFLLQLRNRIDRYILLLVLSSSLFFFFFFFFKIVLSTQNFHFSFYYYYYCYYYFGLVYALLISLENFL